MRRSPIALLAAGLIFLALPAPPVAAQDPADADPGVPLGLAEALRTALANNLDLVIARRDPQIAEAGIDVQKAAFDPVLGVTAEFARNDVDETISYSTLVDDEIVVVEEDDDSTTDSPLVGVSWAQSLKFGGRYDVTVRALESDTSPSIGFDQTTGFIVQSDPLYQQGSLALNFEMPLLRGFGTEVTTADIVLARSGLEISQEDLRLQAQSTLQSVENAYWDLLASIEALRVARESLSLAQDLLALNRKKVEVGTLAPIEITQAEAGVASREESVILAETAVENAEDELRQLLAVPKGDPSWFRRIVPTDRPEYREMDLDSDALLAKALERRPEIVTARKRLQDAELSERVAKNAVKHDLTLGASVGPTRSDYDVRLSYINQDLLPQDAKTTMDELDWRIGLTYGIPVFNRAAKANYAVATLNREKSELGVQSVEQTIRVDVRRAVRSVDSGVKRVAAARANTVLQRRTLEAEQKKFDNGMSTSFEVLQIQTDLLNAQVAEIRAILDYTKALADLERAKGTLLEARGLALADAGRR